MIIFGWGFQTIKNFGPAFKRLCDHCSNEEYWILDRTINWFTLFFVPIFPYKIKHRLSCPICKYGLELNGEQTGQIKPLAELNQLLVDGKITEQGYQAQMHLLNGGTSESVEVEAISDTIGTQSIPENTPLTYCENCGQKGAVDFKFCGNCGTAKSIK